MTESSKTSEDDRKAYEADEDEQELTFEHGYGAQEGVLSENESIEDVAGVSEKDIENDLLGERLTDEADRQESDGK